MNGKKEVVTIGRSVIEIDIYGDLVCEFRRRLRDIGYERSVVDALDAEKLVLQFLNFSRRAVFPVPRNIHKAKSFAPSQEHASAMARIEHLIRTGAQITPYLSSRIKQLDYFDDMLNDWGIHHLHLGDTYETKGASAGFVKRTKALLYAIFTHTDAYFIDVREHGDWTTQEIMEIVHDNWPALLRKRRTNSGGSRKLKDSEIKELRRKNFNYSLVMNDGTAYLVIGGGLTLAGSNALDSVWRLRLLHWASQEQERVIDFIRHNEDDLSRKFGHSVRLKLRLEDVSASVEDTHSGVAFCIERIPIPEWW